MNNENQKIGERLWQERNRLGWTQTEMARRGGVGISTYSSYEAGNSSPKAENLQLWASHGVDVLFVITGEVASNMLTPDEATLLGYWRDSPDTLRAGWLAFHRAYSSASHSAQED